MTNHAVSNKTAMFGEERLGEEIRPVSEARERGKEGAKLGFTNYCFETKKNKLLSCWELKIVPVENLRGCESRFGSQVSQAESFDS